MSTTGQGQNPANAAQGLPGFSAGNSSPNILAQLKAQQAASQASQSSRIALDNEAAWKKFIESLEKVYGEPLTYKASFTLDNYGSFFADREIEYTDNNQVALFSPSSGNRVIYTEKSIIHDDFNGILSPLEAQQTVIDMMTHPAISREGATINLCEKKRAMIEIMREEMELQMGITLPQIHNPLDPSNQEHADALIQAKAQVNAFLRPTAPTSAQPTAGATTNPTAAAAVAGMAAGASPPTSTPSNARAGAGAAIAGAAALGAAAATPAAATTPPSTAATATGQTTSPANPTPASTGTNTPTSTGSTTPSTTATNTSPLAQTASAAPIAVTMPFPSAANPSSVALATSEPTPTEKIDAAAFDAFVDQRILEGQSTALLRDTFDPITLKALRETLTINVDYADLGKLETDNALKTLLENYGTESSSPEQDTALEIAFENLYTEETSLNFSEVQDATDFAAKSLRYVQNSEDTPYGRMTAEHVDNIKTHLDKMIPGVSHGDNMFGTQNVNLWNYITEEAKQEIIAATDPRTIKDDIQRKNDPKNTEYSHEDFQSEALGEKSHTATAVSLYDDQDTLAVETKAAFDNARREGAKAKVKDGIEHYRARQQQPLPSKSPS